MGYLWDLNQDYLVSDGDHYSENCVYDPIYYNHYHGTLLLLPLYSINPSLTAVGRPE